MTSDTTQKSIDEQIKRFDQLTPQEQNELVAQVSKDLDDKQMRHKLNLAGVYCLAFPIMSTPSMFLIGDEGPLSSISFEVQVIISLALYGIVFLGGLGLLRRKLLGQRIAIFGLIINAALMILTFGPATLIGVILFPGMFIGPVIVLVVNILLAKWLSRPDVKSYLR